jgi:hypothetical protein
MTIMGLVAEVRDADGRRVALDDPSGGTFDAAGDFDRLIPALAEDNAVAVRAAQAVLDRVMGAGRPGRPGPGDAAS